MLVAEHVLKLKKDSNLLNDYKNASLQGRNTKGYGGVEGRAENTELLRSHREGTGKPSLCMWGLSETWAHVREESTDGAGHMERSTLRNSSCDRASGWGDQSRRRQHTCIWGPYALGDSSVLFEEIWRCDSELWNVVINLAINMRSVRFKGWWILGPRVT